MVRRKEERYRGHGRSVEVMQTGRWSNGYGRESIEGGREGQADKTCAARIMGEEGGRGDGPRNAEVMERRGKGSRTKGCD